MIEYEISSEEILQKTRKKKILECADYMIDYNLTVRQVAEECMIPRSTVHRWLTYDLKYKDYEKYVLCKRILRNHRKSVCDLYNRENGRFKKVNDWSN